MRTVLRRLCGWRKLAGGGLILGGVVLWFVGIAAPAPLFSAIDSLDVAIGGAMAVGGIAVIGTGDHGTDHSGDSWYDNG
jgi:hypothetical protein